MSPMKRAFPSVVWLAAFMLLLMVFLPGLWLLREETAPAAYLPDFSLLFHTDNLFSFMPLLETALHATILCLALGYPAGCFLALYKRRTAVISWLMPVFFIIGAILLYSQKMIVLFPQGIAANFLLTVQGRVPPAASAALILLPLMVLCTSSFAAAVDPALAKAARGLGASRPRAFLTCFFPRTLKGVSAGCCLVFFPALGLIMVSGQGPGATFLVAAALCAVLLILNLVIILICILTLKKARSVSPC